MEAQEDVSTVPQDTIVQLHRLLNLLHVPKVNFRLLRVQPARYAQSIFIVIKKQLLILATLQLKMDFIL